MWGLLSLSPVTGPSDPFALQCWCEYGNVEFAFTHTHATIYTQWGLLSNTHIYRCTLLFLRSLSPPPQHTYTHKIYISTCNPLSLISPDNLCWIIESCTPFSISPTINSMCNIGFSHKTIPKIKFFLHRWIHPIQQAEKHEQQHRHHGCGELQWGCLWLIITCLPLLT